MSELQQSVALLKSYLEGQKPGDITISIEAPPGTSSQAPTELLLHGNILSLASPVLSAALESSNGGTLKVRAR